MSKIYTVVSENPHLVGIQIDGNVNWFENSTHGRRIAKQFGLLFHHLTSPTLNKLRLNKLQKLG